jgi:hypothetical protein
MNCKEIVCEYLEKIGADGLCNADNKCGCYKSDICLGDQFWEDCEPAYAYEANSEDCEELGWDYNGAIFFAVNADAGDRKRKKEE